MGDAECMCDWFKALGSKQPAWVSYSIHQQHIPSDMHPSAGHHLG